MTDSDRTHQHDARWLGDAAGQHAPDRLRAALDILLAPEPDAASVERAHRRGRVFMLRDHESTWYDRVDVEPVGAVFLALTQRGLAALDFGMAEEEFVERMERGLYSVPRRDSTRLAEAARQIREYLGGAREAFDLPLDTRLMTDFQRRVLDATMAVPRGSVATYGQIARRIGKPRAARAVGQALGRNPIPIVIPCHRVLASDGSLGGYSGGGGVATKRRLLQLEGAL